MAAKYKYVIPTEEANVLVDPIILSLLKKVEGKNISIEQQGLRLADIASATQDSCFKKPQSTMKMDRIREIANSVHKKTQEIAKKLSSQLAQDPLDQEIAAIECAMQLRAAVLIRLAIFRAKDSAHKWENAFSTALKITAGALATGTVAAIIAFNLRRKEDPEGAYERGKKRKNAAGKSKNSAE